MIRLSNDRFVDVQVVWNGRDVWVERPEVGHGGANGAEATRTWGLNECWERRRVENSYPDF